MILRMLPAVVVALSREPGFSESYEPTRFEMLAFEVGVTEDELRGVPSPTHRQEVRMGHTTSTREVLVVWERFRAQQPPCSFTWSTGRSPGARCAPAPRL